MAQIITVRGKQIWGTGKQTYEAVVPVTTEAVRVVVDRTSFTGPQIPDGIKLNWWLSQNNGITWDYQGGIGIPIGVAQVNGSTISESGFQRPLPGIGNNQRRVRITFDIMHEAVNTSLTLTLLP